MVSTKHKYLVREHNFLGEQIGEHLNRVLTAIDIVTEEEETARSEMHSQRPQQLGEGDQVGNISVEITKHIHGRLQFEETRFRSENVLFRSQQRGKDLLTWLH